MAMFNYKKWSTQNLWAPDHKKENCNKKKSHHENHTRFQEGNSKNALLEEHRKLRRLKNQIPEEEHPIILTWQLEKTPSWGLGGDGRPKKHCYENYAPLSARAHILYKYIYIYICVCVCLCITTYRIFSWLSWYIPYWLYYNSINSMKVTANSANLRYFELIFFQTDYIWSQNPGPRIHRLYMAPTQLPTQGQWWSWVRTHRPQS